MKPRAAFLMTHPTQYHAPWFRALAQRPELSIHVYYGFRPSPELQGKDFGVRFEWDSPLLEGYQNSFLENVASTPRWGFGGVDTPGLKRLILKREFNAWIINGWSTKSEWQGIRACWAAGIPMLVRGDSTLIDRRSLGMRALKRLWLGRWIPRFSRYLTVGKLNEEYYRFYGADPKLFVPVRHFVDNEWFSSASATAREHRASLRKSLGIMQNAVVFLFAGKLMEKKQPFAALQALSLLHGADRNVHLLIVGDGELRGQCVRFAEEHELPVTFSGFMNQSRMPEAYAAADVLVLPSTLHETWGLVVNEAMACALPAIVSDKVGCAPDLVIPGETGEIFPAGRIAALADRMGRYARAPGEARRQGARAAEHVGGYSLEDATENTVRAIIDSSRS